MPKSDHTKSYIYCFIIEKTIIYCYRDLYLGKALIKGNIYGEHKLHRIRQEILGNTFKI